MCGITGILSKKGQPRQERIGEMCRLITHRGPDDHGTYAQGPVALGHRRLAILDLSTAGQQPMTTPDGRFSLVFNGEIYNYQELAKRYLADVKLKSTSDTEVLLHVLARHGMEIVPHLKGMFSFALWDVRQQELWLVRDPFGKKPLYLRETTEEWSFASELKSLLISAPELDREACAQYFLYEYIPTPRTPWQDISQLPLGHYCHIKGNIKQVVRWWQPQFTPKTAVSFNEALTQCDQLLQTAIARRLVSDVPVGIFLSGGIDSTAIGWYMRQQMTAKPHSFSVSFREPSFDESAYALQAAHALGTAHHQLQFTLKEFTKSVGQVVPLLDVPLGDASLLPTAAISFLAREYVTVVLDGDGSDELLGGYGIFPAAAVAEKLRFIPSQAWRLAATVAQKLPTNYRDFSFDFKLKSFIRGMGEQLPQRQQVWLGSFTAGEIDELLAPDWRLPPPAIFEPTTRLQPQLAGLNTADQVSLLLIYGYLHDDLLVKLDRATMFASVEARTPFLDVDFAEFAMQLPPAWKKNKKILKQVMSGRIPQAIISRHKKGFGIPLGWWLKGPLHDWAKQVLEPSKLLADGMINPQVPLRLLAQHRQGTADHRKKLWTLLSWQLWYDQWAAKREFLLP